MEEYNRLTETVNCGGCAGKLNAIDLYKSLSILPHIDDSRIVSGFKKSEDASVMKLSDDIAIVFSTDFISPILDDPYDYGRAAAVHALSDIYALGATPIMALNIVCFQEDLGKDVLEGILLGGNEICERAGVIVGGGHTVSAPELRYGLAVIGQIHPKKVILNTGGKVGDILVITKPLGVGVLAQALKYNILSPQLLEVLTNHMCTLNDGGCRAMQKVGVNAATDVSGFGLAGHIHQLSKASDCAAVIYGDKLPLLPDVEEFVAHDIFSQALEKNREYVIQHLTEPLEESNRIPLLFDPQTSGGLLIAVSRQQLKELIVELEAEGCPGVIIGELTDGVPGTWRLGSQQIDI